eukprot:COSAG01_NODE_7547_length_3156_cov_20.612692_3_plen_155_part_00
MPTCVHELVSLTVSMQSTDGGGDGGGCKHCGQLGQAEPQTHERHGRLSRADRRPTNINCVCFAKELAQPSQHGSTGAGEDNGIDHNKNRLRFPSIVHVCDPIMSSRTRSTARRSSHAPVAVPEAGRMSVWNDGGVAQIVRNGELMIEGRGRLGR